MSRRASPSLPAEPPSDPNDNTAPPAGCAEYWFTPRVNAPCRLGRAVVDATTDPGVGAFGVRQPMLRLFFSFCPKGLGDGGTL